MTLSKQVTKAEAVAWLAGQMSQAADVTAERDAEATLADYAADFVAHMSQVMAPASDAAQEAAEEPAAEETFRRLVVLNGEPIIAKTFSWDGCHKIYVHEDDAAERSQRANEYDIYEVAQVVRTEGGRDISMLEDAWEQSCSLRFISALIGDDFDEDYVSQFGDEDEEVTFTWRTTKVAA